MLPYLRPLTNVPGPASVFLVLAAVVTHHNVVHAQSQDPPYYYWLSPGRIVGIAVGAIALVLVILSMLIFACRRRRHAKATSKVMVSNYPAAGGHPQAFPSWQEAQQTSFGPAEPNMGWRYPAQSTAPSDQVKSAAPPDQAQRTTPSEQMPMTTPFGEAQRTPPSVQVQRPAPAIQVPSTATPGQVQRVAPPGQAQSPVPSSQAQRTAPPGEVQSIAPSGRTQSTAPLVRTQEQGAPPPPRHAHTKETPSVGAADGRDQSPPPYYPPTGPLTTQ